MTDLVEIHFIELKKFNNTHKEYNDRLHRWLKFIQNPEDTEVIEIMEYDDKIKEAMDVLSYISGDEEVVRLAEQREKALLDEESRLSGAREEGIKKGIEKGIEQGIEKGKEEGKLELLLKMLNKKFKGLPNDYIKKIKELTEDKIEAIGENIFDIDNLEGLNKYLN